MRVAPPLSCSVVLLAARLFRRRGKHFAGWQRPSFTAPPPYAAALSEETSADAAAALTARCWICRGRERRGEGKKVGGGSRGRAAHLARVGSADPSIIPGKLARNEWFCFHSERKLRFEQKVDWRGSFLLYLQQRNRIKLSGDAWNFRLSMCHF